MKSLIRKRSELLKAGRWDIDFHLPAEGIKQFPPKLLARVDTAAALPKDKRDPNKTPETVFQYIDISSVEVTTGTVTNPQELEGSEAPSRARKVVCAFDLLISTCRPTRGAIAVVPPSLHNQVASTGFSILRPNANVNPFYLQYALRLSSTLEQFRKWSTGSSYPAILDEDVAKTLIPIPDSDKQDEIAQTLMNAVMERNQSIQVANESWKCAQDEVFFGLSGEKARDISPAAALEAMPHTIKEIREVIGSLPPLTVDRSTNVMFSLSLEELEVAFASDP